MTLNARPHSVAWLVFELSVDLSGELSGGLLVFRRSNLVKFALFVIAQVPHLSTQVDGDLANAEVLRCCHGETVLQRISVLQAEISETVSEFQLHVITCVT